MRPRRPRASRRQAGRRSAHVAAKGEAPQIVGVDRLDVGAEFRTQPLDLRCDPAAARPARRRGRRARRSGATRFRSLAMTTATTRPTPEDHGKDTTDEQAGQGARGKDGKRSGRNDRDEEEGGAEPEPDEWQNRVSILCASAAQRAGDPVEEWIAARVRRRSSSRLRARGVPPYREGAWPCARASARTLRRRRTGDRYTDRTREQNVTAEGDPVSVKHDVAGGVSRHVPDVEAQVADGQHVALAQCVIGERTELEGDAVGASPTGAGARRPGDRRRACRSARCIFAGSLRSRQCDRGARG